MWMRWPERSFENDLEYQQLAVSLSEMDQLRKAVATYNDLRLCRARIFPGSQPVVRLLDQQEPRR